MRLRQALLNLMSNANKRHLRRAVPSLLGNVLLLLSGIATDGEQDSVVATLAEMGAWTLPGSPADCGKLIVEEIEKWAKVVRAGNIKPE
jgi:hypothetical protein